MKRCVEVANKARHWVRLTTACNNRCIFCLDGDTPRDVFMPTAQLEQEIERGRNELGARRVILSGGEPTLHPDFLELVAFARSRGYERVQTVTNGSRFADRAFFEAAMAAGLGEITFSLHGHAEELHDRLTGSPGAFRRLMKGLVRAVRDRRPIVNVDIVINQQNVDVVPDIVELCMGLGVTEFDLLHLIPQGRAFDHRDELFYDVREHLPTLQRVFRLNRHPRIVVWTNRFPVEFLEGLEELIQDPHKLLDEVNGRRYQVRRYLDVGEPLDCREPARCRHCFVEPFCTTMDRVVAGQNRCEWEVWWLGTERWNGRPLPYDCRLLGVAVRDLADLDAVARPDYVGLYATVASAEPLPVEIGQRRPVVLVASDPAQLDAWLAAPLPPNVEVDIRLTRPTAQWLLAHRGELIEHLERVVICQPAHEHLEGAKDHDVLDLAGFFRKLAVPVRTAGLPACLAPGTELTHERQILYYDLFDSSTGRLHVRELARYHVAKRYRAKSVRCADCPVTARCEGAPINMIRHQGLAQLVPLSPGSEADAARQQLAELWPEPPLRLATGRPPEPVAESLPGCPPPAEPPLDPLAIIELERIKRALDGHTGQPVEDDED